MRDRGRAVCALVLALALMLGVADQADAEASRPLDLADTPAELTITAGWTLEPAAGPVGDVLAALRGPGALRATVVRLATPNPRAWNASKRDAYVAEVVAGFAASASGRIAAQRTTSPVPTIDIDLVRATPRQAVRARVLLFRTYTLVLVIVGSEADARNHRQAVDRLRDGLALPAGWSPTS